MSDTPRTNVSAFKIIDATDEYPRQHVYCSDGEYVGSNFARQLESEIAELELQLETIRNDTLEEAAGGASILGKLSTR